MRIRNLLGLSDRKKDVEKRADAVKKDSPQPKQDKIPAAVQDLCCGSCGGHGHADKKGSHG